MARERTREQQAKNKRNYDHHLATKRWSPFTIGETVKVKEHARPTGSGAGISKFRTLWRGPFTIKARKGAVYQLADATSERWINGSQLARWYGKKPLKEGKSVVVPKAMQATQSKRQTDLRNTECNPIGRMQDFW